MSVPDPIPEPLSWQLIAKVVGLLQGVTVENGYRTDFGLNVRPNRYVADEGEGQHCVVVVGDITVTRTSGRTRQSAIDVLIECRVPLSGDEIDDAEKIAHRARQDVIDAIPVRQAEIQWPPYCSGLTIVSSRILERPQGLNFVVAQVTARADLVERQARD